MSWHVFLFPCLFNKWIAGMSWTILFGFKSCCLWGSRVMVRKRDCASQATQELLLAQRILVFNLHLHLSYIKLGKLHWLYSTLFIWRLVTSFNGVQFYLPRSPSCQWIHFSLHKLAQFTLMRNIFCTRQEHFHSMTFHLHLPTDEQNR